MAPEETGITLGQKAVEQIGKTVREVSRRMMNEQPHRARWQYQGANTAIRHGIVTADLGCGRYTIEKATWCGDPATDGVGLGSGSGINDCNPCYDVTGEGTSACAITLTYPPLQVTGTGVYVTAHSHAWKLIPLVIGQGCLIVNLGDRDNNGSGADTPIWQIITGMPNHEVYYEETRDCCNGVGETGIETVLTKTPSIVVAKRCAPINCGTCDPGSGSASA